MTQRVFDIENEKDYADLWEIVPEETDKITLEDGRYHLYGKDGFCIAIISGIIKINWHEKTEITRPVNYEDMIGCVGWFSNKKGDKKYCFGILDIYDDKDKSNDGKNFHCRLIGWYKYFTPAKKSELKFWGDD